MWKDRTPMNPRSNRLAVSLVLMALGCALLCLGWVQKSPCRDSPWTDQFQYRHYCYTDVVALYFSEGLSDGKVPYRDHAVEYPVLTGAFMGAIGLPVHAMDRDLPGMEQAKTFFDLNALGLILFGAGTLGCVLLLRQRRPWDAAVLALSPVLVVTALVNWDLLAVGLAAFGLLAWARRRPVLAGVLFGLGASAKLWPLFVLGPLLLLGLRAGRLRPVLAAIGAGAATVLAVNLPVALAWPDGWKRFFDLNQQRPIDWGTSWYVLRYLDQRLHSGGSSGPFQWLGNHVDPQLNLLTLGLFGLACAGVAVLALLAPRRPRLAQLVFLVVAAFLITSKVWSQQYVLWLLPLVALARPPWRAVIAWQAAELGYFVTFYREMRNASGTRVMAEGVFDLAAGARALTVLLLAVLVVRQVLRPELDPVRRSYDDDPDGGVLDGAADAAWLSRLRRPRSPAGAAGGDGERLLEGERAGVERLADDRRFDPDRDQLAQRDEIGQS
jgi:uncharacterized membrane protein